MITYKLAQQIVEQTMLRLHHNINVISLDGTIIASGDPSRVEHLHTAAHEVLTTKQPVLISEENRAKYPNAKLGINMPIFFQGEIVCIVGITGNPIDLQELSKLVQLTTEVMVNQALIESKSEWQRKMSVHIFTELIEGSPIKGILKERMDKLDFTFQSPYCITLIRAKHKTSSHRTLIQYLEDYFYDQPVLYGHHGLDEYYILTTSTSELAIKKLIQSLNNYLAKHFSLSIGVGQVVYELEQISTCYRSAKLAVEEASRIEKLVFFEEIKIKSLFNPEDAWHYAQQLIHNVNDKLLETLDVLFKNNLQLIATAEELEIHRHTLTYRLSKIQERTALNPLVFEDALQLQIALWFHKKMA